MRQAWINLYISGYYHRAGKPGQYNVHPGDLYPTEEAAKLDIDPNAPYFATVPVTVPDGISLGDVNPPDSVPMALSTSKAVYQEYGMDALIEFNGSVI